MNFMNNDLPKGWRLAKFPDVIYFQEGPGVRKWQFREEGIKLINVKNIVNGKLDTSNTGRHLEESEVESKYSHFLLNEGDFVVASSGVTWGKVAQVKQEHLPLCLNTSMIRLRPINHDDVYHPFIPRFIDSPYFTHQIDRLITGSAQPNFGPAHLKQIFIPLPPLKIQKQISAVLEKADALRQQCQQAQKKMDSLVQSVFLEMFGDPVTNPKGWETKNLPEIISSEKYSMKRGPFGGALKKEIFLDTGYLVYEQFHALNDDFTMARYFIDNKKFDELKAFEVKPGDLIISCSGVNLGKLA